MNKLEVESLKVGDYVEPLFSKEEEGIYFCHGIDELTHEDLYGRIVNIERGDYNNTWIDIASIKKPNVIARGLNAKYFIKPELHLGDIEDTNNNQQSSQTIEEFLASYDGYSDELEKYMGESLLQQPITIHHYSSGYSKVFR